MTDNFTKDERIADLQWHIDNGFINHKKCLAIFGDKFLQQYNKYKYQDTTFPNNVQNDHLFVRLAIAYCAVNKIPTLSEVLQSPKVGDIFCSVNKFAGNPDVYKLERVTNEVLLPFPYDKKVKIEFSTKLITCDTGKVEQNVESDIAIIGRVYSLNDEEIILHPLIMGAPTFDTPFKEQSVAIEKLFFSRGEWFEMKPDEIDNFSLISTIDTVTPDEWQNYMKTKSEDEIKLKFCEILGDTPKSDWGGELNDHFSNSVKISNKPFTAAFLFKGPAGGSKFREMLPKDLGKNGDQICRLSKTPGQLIVVQHCHDIGEAVRETLQAFAVAPHIQKRFCIIDGKDTYRLLKAYGKL